MESAEKLFQLKKAKFLEAVLRAASSRKGAPLPYVNFEGESCPGFRGAGVEWAHIHVELNMICISKASLSMMTDEQIQETADHEVSHLFASLGHGPDFTYQNMITSIGAWRPQPGVVVIYGGNKVEVEEKCNHTQCEQEKELEKCLNCDVFFCKKHLAPHLEKVGDEAEDQGHVCPALTEFKKVEGLRQSGLIDIHRFITKMFNVHLNAFIAEYATPSALGVGGNIGGVKFVKVKDARLAQLADLLKYERDRIAGQKDLVTEELFRESIVSFLFSVYEVGLKIEPHTPEVKEKLLIPLSILFESIDAYWKDTNYIKKLKQPEPKISPPYIKKPKQPKSIFPPPEPKLQMPELIESRLGLQPEVIKKPIKIKTLIAFSLFFLVAAILVLPHGYDGTNGVKALAHTIGGNLGSGFLDVLGRSFQWLRGNNYTIADSKEAQIQIGPGVKRFVPTAFNSDADTTFIGDAKMAITGLAFTEPTGQAGVTIQSGTLYIKKGAAIESTVDLAGLTANNTEITQLVHRESDVFDNYRIFLNGGRNPVTCTMSRCDKGLEISIVKED